MKTTVVSGKKEEDKVEDKLRKDFVKTRGLFVASLMQCESDKLYEMINKNMGKPRAEKEVKDNSSKNQPLLG